MRFTDQSSAFDRLLVPGDLFHHGICNHRAEVGCGDSSHRGDVCSVPEPEERTNRRLVGPLERGGEHPGIESALTMSH